MVGRAVREFGGLRIETVEWPIVVMDWPESRVPEAELRASLDYLEQLMLECQGHREMSYQVTDLTRIKELPSAVQRQYAGDWVKRNWELLKTVSLGGVNVAPSAVVRGTVTAVYWIQRPPTPVAFIATRAEAMLHAVAVLEGAHVPLPPSVRELRDRLVPGVQGTRGNDAPAGSWRRRDRS
jgi:hypothetical protein